MTRISRLIAAIAVALSIGALSPDASAALTGACTVSSVGLEAFSTPVPRLTIVCSGTSYFANQGGPYPGGSCSAVSMDVSKVWESLATSAFLSGKHLNISYTPGNSSCSTNLISGVFIVN